VLNPAKHFLLVLGIFPFVAFEISDETTGEAERLTDLGQTFQTYFVKYFSVWSLAFIALLTVILKKMPNKRWLTAGFRTLTALSVAVVLMSILVHELILLYLEPQMTSGSPGSSFPKFLRSPIPPSPPCFLGCLSDVDFRCPRAVFPRIRRACVTFRVELRNAGEDGVAENPLADAMDEHHAPLALANGDLQHPFEVTELEIEHGAVGETAGAVDQLMQVQVHLDQPLLATG